MKPLLGLQRGTVRLESYNPRWREFFEKEKSALKQVLGDRFIAAEHVGSTAIPSLKAKPILDLMLAIENLSDWDWLKEPLSKLGYVFCRDSTQEKRRILFVKGPQENRTHYLKVAEFNSDFWTEHIIFRDYLISNSRYREEYQKLKENLFDTHAVNRELYTKGKEEFIQKILKLAEYEGKK
ncbi:GrpB family protein [candidate division WWE3 bacterium]|nr:GrpB family protein [candidate division WWE3 bacterium]